MGELEAIDEIAVSHAECGKYFKYQEDLIEKVKITDHDKFVYGWTVSGMDIAIFEAVEILPPDEDKLANPKYFNYENPRSRRWLKYLEIKGLCFKHTDYYHKIKNMDELDEIGT